MSFILDALKKSEAERQRQAGPTLLEVRVTQPRRRYPPWLIVITALLLANVAVLLAFLLRRPAPSAPASAPLAAVPSAPPPRLIPQATAAPPAVSPAAAVTTPVAASAPSVAAAPTEPASGSANAADDQPAIDPRTATSAARLPHEGIDFSTLPSFQEVAGSVPDLRLDLHVYDDQPSKRYALINMHRVQEGEMLPEGVRVLAITAAGVALDYRGQQFMLHPQ